MAIDETAPQPVAEIQPTVLVPPAAAAALGLRILDPVTAAPLPGGRRPKPTVYVGNSLLISGPETAGALEHLSRTAESVGVRAVHHPPEASLLQQVSSGGKQTAEIAATHRSQRVRLLAGPDNGSPEWPVDAWPLMQMLREKGFGPQTVGLDHAVTACGIGGVPYMVGMSPIGGVPYMVGMPSVGGSPYMVGMSPASQYAMPGAGGRAPVCLQVPDPAIAAPKLKRPPVVCIPDTGLGKHPWFADPEMATDEVYVAGLRIGLGGDFPDCQEPPDTRSPLDGSVRADAGHGTFIAGLIRQLCPQARILAPRVMTDDGVVPETALLRTLTALLMRHVSAIEQNRPQEQIDVLSLSLGYYHESPDDELFDTPLAAVLREFGKYGVAVVAAAGNSASTAKMYPAAFAGQVDPGGFDSTKVPLVSVGALNPGEGSVAYFSNAGDWVSCHRPGAAMVSTVPVDLGGELQYGAQMNYSGRHRSLIDPDDYSCGFATWSGTSFAAPVLAGQIAARIAEQEQTLGLAGSKAAVERTWEALRAELPEWAGR